MAALHAAEMRATNGNGATGVLTMVPAVEEVEEV